MHIFLSKKQNIYLNFNIKIDNISSFNKIFNMPEASNYGRVEFKNCIISKNRNVLSLRSKNLSLDIIYIDPIRSSMYSFDIRKIPYPYYGSNKYKADFYIRNTANETLTKKYPNKKSRDFVYDTIAKDILIINSQIFKNYNQLEFSFD